MAMTKCPGCNLVVIHDKESEELEFDRTEDPPVLLVGGVPIHRCHQLPGPDDVPAESS